jgi:hypothetical protein
LCEGEVYTRGGLSIVFSIGFGMKYNDSLKFSDNNKILRISIFLEDTKESTTLILVSDSIDSK